MENIKIHMNKKIIVFFLVVFVVWGVFQEDSILLQKPTITPKASSFIEYDVGNLVKIKSIGSFEEKKKLAVIVPYRDCPDELSHFVPYMSRFLSLQEVPYHIYIVNQTNDLRFNRAMLINVGFLYTETKYDYITMHDVDLLPLNPKISYQMPDNNSARHVVSYYLHPLGYKHPNFYGGIVLISNDLFRNVDGMCNNYWGWGLEDDEFRNNLLNHGVNLTRTPKDIGTNWANSFVSIHKVRRMRDKQRCKHQRKLFRSRWKNSSLSSTKFNIFSVTELNIRGAYCTLINVEIFCNETKTPWCRCEEMK